MDMNRKDFMKSYSPSSSDRFSFNSVTKVNNSFIFDSLRITHVGTCGTGGKGEKMTEEKVVEIIKREVPPMISAAIAEAVTGLKEFIKDEFDRQLTPIKEDIKEMKEDIKNLKSDVAILKHDVAVLKSDVKQLKQDVKEIKECPTIKRELKLNKTKKSKKGNNQNKPKK